MKFLAISFFTLLFFSQSLSADWYPDRRRNQFPSEPAYLVVPLPYSYPGIGEGLFLLGNASNIYETTADIYAVEIIGDATGRAAQFLELPLIKHKLFASLTFQDINRAAVNQYDIRGMKGSDGNNFKLLDITQADSNAFRLDYLLNERRINFYLSHTEEEYTVSAILTPDGTTVFELPIPETTSSTTNLFGVSFDYTDDYIDPLSGIRATIELIDRPAETSNKPDFYILNYSFLYFTPVNNNDTIVVNYFQSDAYVRTPGNTSLTYHQGLPSNNLNCDAADTACQQSETALVNSSIDSAKYGSSTPLGGLERLRSYPLQRYQGAHTGFIGAEYRLNITEEATPFNYFFWKDVRTGKQVAFFAEAGSVSELSSDLWDEKRYTYGVGFRLLTASGSVYRADFASGDEGNEVAIFFFYPWK